MAEIKTGKNFLGKRGSKGKMTNIPLGNTGHESSGKSGELTKDGRIYRNDLLDTDWTSQTGMVKKTKSL